MNGAYLQAFVEFAEEAVLLIPDPALKLLVEECHLAARAFQSYTCFCLPEE